MEDGLRQAMGKVTLATRGKGLYDLTTRLRGFPKEARVREGLLTLFCQHTSASLIIQENADPDVQTDLTRFFERIAPEEGDYVHRCEGVDDMPAHIRTALTQTQLAVPVIDNELALGTWQGIYLFEHRRAPHQRTIILHLLGE